MSPVRWARLAPSGDSRSSAAGRRGDTAPVLGRSASLAAVARGATLLLAAGLLAAPSPRQAAGEEAEAFAPNRVEAVFIRNFARYVSWPAEAFSDAHAPYRVGVVGKDPFGDVLDQTLQGRVERDRAFEIHRSRTLAGLPPCHIVVVAIEEPERRRAALVALRKAPVLTVGDAPEFLREGGIVRFDVGERVQLSVNLDAARGAGLRIETKVLEVSHEVLENGVLRKVRW